MSGVPSAGPDPAHPPTVHPPTAVVSGYASLFGSLDDAGDLVMRGAFHRSLRERGPAGIRFLWQHDPARPIGVFEEMREDRSGLFLKGRLLTGTTTGREAAVLIAAGALDGLSIGFRARSARRDAHTGIRRLYDIDLWEVSLVTFPLHPGARLAAPGSLALPTPKHRSLRPS